MAVQTAAGLFDDKTSGYGGRGATDGDGKKLVWLASRFGLTKDEDVTSFRSEAFHLAGSVLDWDGGTAWEMVAAKLMQKGELTGDEVLKIIEAADGPLSSPEQFWSEVCEFVEVTAGLSDDEFKAQRARYRSVRDWAEQLRKESEE